MKMSGHVKERKVFYPDFSRGCIVSVEKRYLTAERRNFSELRGECIPRSQTHRKEITYSTESRAESRSKSVYDSPSHRIAAEKESGQRASKLFPPEELNRWLDGRTEREIKVG